MKNEKRYAFPKFLRDLIQWWRDRHRRRFFRLKFNHIAGRSRLRAAMDSGKARIPGYDFTKTFDDDEHHPSMPPAKGKH